jgi:Sel1 repeat
LGRAYSARGEFSKARAFFLKAAQANFALAEVDLGSFYFNGLGAPRDYEEAVKWDRLAAGQGLAPAQSNLGIMYLEGRGVAQDSAEAVKWLQAAAAQGFAPAQYSLAALYASGRGVKPNFAEAQRLYGEAANQGYAPAEAGFPWAEAEGQSFDRRYGEAGKGADPTAAEETEPAQPTPDKLSSNEPDDSRNLPPEGSDDKVASPQSRSPANTRSPGEPGARPSDPIAARPSPAIFLQGRLEGEASGGGQPPVAIVVKLLDHRNSSRVATVALEVSPRSNQFSMSSLSVNDGACRVYIQDPSIFARGRRADPAAKGDADSDKGGKDLAAALAKIALPKIPFDQPMVAEFGQYLQFYTDPSLCAVRQVAVAVNGHEWQWLSTSGIPVAAGPKSDDRMGQSPNPAPEAKP